MTLGVIQVIHNLMVMFSDLPTEMLELIATHDLDILKGFLRIDRRFHDRSMKPGMHFKYAYPFLTVRGRRCVSGMRSAPYHYVIYPTLYRDQLWHGPDGSYIVFIYPHSGETRVQLNGSDDSTLTPYDPGWWSDGVAHYLDRSDPNHSPFKYECPLNLCLNGNINLVK